MDYIYIYLLQKRTKKVFKGKQSIQNTFAANFSRNNNVINGSASYLLMEVLATVSCSWSLSMKASTHQSPNHINAD